MLPLGNTVVVLVVFGEAQIQADQMLQDLPVAKLVHVHPRKVILITTQVVFHAS